MKILLLGSHLNYNLEYYVYKALRMLGHEVEFYGYRADLGALAGIVRMTVTRSKLMHDLADSLLLIPIDRKVRHIAASFRPDLVLVTKGEAVKHDTVSWFRKELGIKTALWYPDDPRFFESFTRYVAPSYEYVFTSCLNAVRLYRNIGARHVHCIPFACDPSTHTRIALTEEERRKYRSSIVFVGTYSPKRASFIKGLLKSNLDVSIYGSYWKYFIRGQHTHDGVFGVEMAKIYNCARIVLNFHEDSQYGPNMRVFEATGCGSLLLTDTVADMNSFFNAGKELVVFEDLGDLISKLRYYLRNENDNRAISDAGYERSHSDHTYEVRLKGLLEVVK